MKNTFDIIYCAIEEINKLNPQHKSFEKIPQAVLLGVDGGMDSLNLVHFIAILERKIFETYDLSISLVDDSIFSKSGPFATVSTLEGFIQHKIELFR